MENEITAEQIAQHYSAAMDSVNLINGGQPEEKTFMALSLSMTDAEWADCLARNKEHLAKDYWTTEDLTPLRTASV